MSTYSYPQVSTEGSGWRSDRNHGTSESGEQSRRGLSTGVGWRLVTKGGIVACLFGALVFGGFTPPPAHAAKRGRAVAAKGKKAPVKRQKELLNIMESGAIPNEEVEKANLVVAKVPPPGSFPKPTPQARVAARHVRGGKRPPAVKPESAPPPEVPETFSTEPVAKPKPVAVAAPKPTTPDFAGGETGKSIDAMLAKAMVPTEGQPAKTKPAEAPVATTATALQPAEIAQVMKPVNAQVRKTCPFGERGLVTMRIEVGEGGQVAQATPEGPFSQRPETACLIAAVKQARIPAAPGVSFRYPFVVR
ncbi:MAG TPA: hypothetical protein VGF45_13670 [Polyangia bacterium]